MRRQRSEMQENLQGAPVIREDGVMGEVVAAATTATGAEVAVIAFADGARVAVSPQMLEAQADGVYRLLLAAAQLAPNGATAERITAERITAEDEVVIPVIAEEIAVSRQQVARGVVRVHKRTETHTATVDAPLTSEEVTVERVPVNALIEGAAPQMREEDGVTIIPVLEEVLVIEKRLLLREEVHLRKRATTANAPQTVTLRRETVEIERSAGDGQVSYPQPESPTTEYETEYETE